MRLELFLANHTEATMGLDSQTLADAEEDSLHLVDVIVVAVGEVGLLIHRANDEVQLVVGKIKIPPRTNFAKEHNTHSLVKRTKKYNQKGNTQSNHSQHAKGGSRTRTPVKA